MQVTEHLRVEVVPARQLLFVQRLEHLGLDQRRDQGGVEHHQVVARAPGQQFGLNRFVAVEGVVDHLDAGGFFKVGEGRFADVIRPVVQPECVARLLAGGERRRCQGREQQTGNHLQCLSHSHSVVSPGSARCEPTGLLSREPVMATIPRMGRCAAFTLRPIAGKAGSHSLSDLHYPCGSRPCRR
ncbi:hypothetical protein D3C79_815350 [compost metagenome]